MKKHLAIFSNGLGEMILSGQKTVESRFSKTKMPPFGEVSAGDLVYIKPTGQDLIGQFKVKKVIFYDGMDVTDLKDIQERYGQEIAADKSFWQKHQGAKFGTLIFIGQTTKFLTSPIKITKKDQRGWVVLE